MVLDGNRARLTASLTGSHSACTPSLIYYAKSGLVVFILFIQSMHVTCCCEDCSELCSFQQKKSTSTKEVYYVEEHIVISKHK
ncbi:hypothetical protein F8388_013591 [Cannabis sativa]|uniref:Uncharacterized protein n=1 Tax=Cannabis sativa TaxID=3483 RepID=A0A7J6G8S6_CANSA|nr:hypothetical protein F8388_013591 [Cannabis sativa]